MKSYNSFLVIIESEYFKQFAFFVPTKFRKTDNANTIDQLLFYNI
jgi:hypothetical protein